MTSNNSLGQAASSIFKLLEFSFLLRFFFRKKNKTHQILPWNKTGIPCENNSLFIDHSFLLEWGFPCGSANKESTCNAGDLGSIPGWGRFPWRRERLLPTPGFWPGEFHGPYSPWGRQESDTTEWLAFSLSLFFPYCMQKSKTILLFATSFCLFLLFFLPTWSFMVFYW